jgi:hypothetical protein
MTTSAPFRMTQKPRLGELMVQLGYLTRPQLDQTLAQARGALGKSVVASGLCSELQVMAALSKQLGLPVVDLEASGLRCTGLLAESVARKHRAIIFERAVPDTDEVLVAMGAPARLDSQDAIRAVVGKSRVRFVLAADSALDRAFARIYANEPAPRVPTPAPSSAVTWLGSAAAARPSFTDGPTDLLARLDLSPRTLEVIRRAAAEVNTTPREVIRRAMESWASTRRAM